jgi:hypothetical protein
VAFGPPTSDKTEETTLQELVAYLGTGGFHYTLDSLAAPGLMTLAARSPYVESIDPEVFEPEDHDLEIRFTDGRISSIRIAVILNSSAPLEWVLLFNNKALYLNSRNRI